MWRDAGKGTAFPQAFPQTQQLGAAPGLSTTLSHREIRQNQRKAEFPDHLLAKATPALTLYLL